MIIRQRYLPSSLMLVVALCLPLTVVAAKDQGFKAVVKHLESHYHAKRKRIPFLRLANLAVKIVKPAGVKSFQVAVFEDQDFSRQSEDPQLEAVMQGALKDGWRPLVRRRSSRDGSGERAYIYAKEAGKDTKLLSVVMEPHQALVVEAKVDPQALIKFMEKPEIMGRSLAGLTAMPSLADLGGNGSSAHRADRQSSSSLASIGRRIDTEPGDLSARPKPTLRTRPGEENDPAAQPNSGSEQPAEAEAAAPRPPVEGVLRLETRLVNLNVKAMDRSGAPLSHLRKEDFAVFEDGVAQEVAFFQPVAAPINLFLLLDLSGSTREKRKDMAQAAKKFIDSLGPSDRIAIGAFTTEFYLLSDFTSDRKLLKGRIDKIKGIRGGTAFYDAMWITLDLLDRLKEARKAIVVLTDGVDNSIQRFGGHTKHTFDELLGRVSEEEATIYPIYLNTEHEIKINFRGRPWADARIREKVAVRQRPYEIARQQLAAIADESAGMLFRADTERDLDGVYQRVAAELHQLYSLAYDPKNTQFNGQFRKISVKVNHDGSMARARRGYYAK